jgi:hypothetical protein
MRKPDKCRQSRLPLGPPHDSHSTPMAEEGQGIIPATGQREVSVGEANNFFQRFAFFLSCFFFLLTATEFQCPTWDSHIF